MRLLLTTCADSGSIDTTTNRLSIFNVIEEIQSALFPSTLPSLSLILALEKNKDESDDVSLTLIGTLNSADLFNFPLEASFDGKKRLRVIANLQGIPLDAPGRLIISVKDKNKSLGIWPIEVLSVGTPTISKKVKRVNSGTSTNKISTKKNIVRKSAKEAPKKLRKTSKKPIARKKITSVGQRKGR